MASNYLNNVRFGAGVERLAQGRFSDVIYLGGAYDAAAMSNAVVHTCNLHCPARWGLPAEVVEDLGARLHRFWQRFRDCFTTRTRDSSPLAFDYLRALLTIERGGRNFANIERRLHGGDRAPPGPPRDRLDARAV